MNFEDKNNSAAQNPILHDLDAMYISAERKRIKEAILKTDTDKFFLFTRMLRINSMLKKAKITHTTL